MTAVTRAWRRGAVVMVIAVATMLGGATPANAHPTLLFTDPAAVPTSPPVISLVFSEAVTVSPHALAVIDGDGHPVPMGPSSTARDGTVVMARLSGVLAPGTYLVRWQVTGSDGDLVDQEFRFAVGTAISGAGSGAQPVSWGDAALRWLLFAGLALALGGVIGERFTTSARAEKPDLPPLRSCALPGALLGLAGVVGLATLLVIDTATVSALWHVTSDTTTGAGPPQRLDLDGAFFVSQEPYASSTAPITVRISHSGQPVRLALGYPAAGITVALTLDTDGRINTETLTDRTHLIHRRFLYPDHH